MQYTVHRLFLKIRCFLTSCIALQESMHVKAHVLNDYQNSALWLQKGAQSAYYCGSSVEELCESIRGWKKNSYHYISCFRIQRRLCLTGSFLHFSSVGIPKQHTWRFQDRQLFFCRKPYRQTSFFLWFYEGLIFQVNFTFKFFCVIDLIALSCTFVILIVLIQ